MKFVERVGKRYVLSVNGGSIRLYRGQEQKFDSKYDLAKSDAPYGYSTWTDSLELARQYAGKNGYVYYLDLPKSEMGKSAIDENPKSETYGDRVLFYFNKKPAGLNGVTGKEVLVYTDHDLYDPNMVKEYATASLGSTYTPTSTFGFHKEPKEEDVVDALQEVSDEDWVVSMTSDYKSGGEDINLDDFHLKLSKVDLADPEDIQDIRVRLVPAAWKRGFLKSVDPGDWVSALDEATGGRDWSYIVKQKLEGKLAPAILINGEFGDGRGRTILQYALDEPVMVAYYTTDLDFVRKD